jgi:hypothetical protein
VTSADAAAAAAHDDDDGEHEHSGREDAHTHTAAYPESQVRTASALFTQPTVPWSAATAGPASQPVEKSWSQSQYLHRTSISNSRSAGHCQKADAE